MRDDKVSEKDKREETSRSESANSEAPTNRLMTHGVSLGGAVLPSLFVFVVRCSFFFFFLFFFFFCVCKVFFGVVLSLGWWFGL